MDVIKIYYLVFGILTILGGVIGFVKAKSRASLIAGGGAGLLLVASGLIIMAGRTNIGLMLGLLVSVALAGQFIPKVLLNRAPIHSIIMAILSAASLILTIISFTKK